MPSHRRSAKYLADRNAYLGIHVPVAPVPPRFPHLTVDLDVTTGDTVELESRDEVQS